MFKQITEQRNELKQLKSSNLRRNFDYDSEDPEKKIDKNSSRNYKLNNRLTSINEVNSNSHQNPINVHNKVNSNQIIEKEKEKEKDKSEREKRLNKLKHERTSKLKKDKEASQGKGTDRKEGNKGSFVEISNVNSNQQNDSYREK